MTETTLHRAARRLLKPLARILLRHGVAFGEFRNIAKQVFVEVASEDFALPNRKQTTARVAMVTGIQRKEVARLLAEQTDEFDPVDLAYNRGVRVISGWRRDPDFLTSEGLPRPLAVESDTADGAPAGFIELVRRYSGDLPPRAVQDELERVGAVDRDVDGLIRLVVNSGYIPLEDRDAQFNIMGHCLADLANTLDHNLQAREGETRLQLTTAYDNLPPEAVEAFRRFSHDRCVALLKELDAWLASRDRDANPAVDQGSSGRFRSGIGIYYIEELYKEPRP